MWSVILIFSILFSFSFQKLVILFALVAVTCAQFSHFNYQYLPPQPQVPQYSYGVSILCKLITTANKVREMKKMFS